MNRLYKCEHCDKEFDDEKECESHELECKYTVDDFAYVAECFIASQTYHENPRYFSMFKETVIVDSDFVEKFRLIKGDECYDIVNDVMYSGVVQGQLPDKLRDMLYEHMIQCGDFDKSNISQIIDGETFTQFYGDEDYHPNDDLVAEVHFKCYYKNEDDLGNAYISVFKLEKEKLELQDLCDIKVRKWITDNITR